MNNQSIVTKLNGIESEIEEIKVMVASSMKPKKNISLRGMAKLLVPENELDKNIEKAKLSLSKRPDDICS